MGTVIPFNDGWVFGPWLEGSRLGALQPGIPVSVPHTAAELPYNYFDEAVYQKPFLYQKNLTWDPAWDGKEVYLVFDGAMADAMVHVNGALVAEHRDGYTPFEVRLTRVLIDGDNLISVRIDGTENPAIPPFGGQIDYLTYAGIYRDVWLRVSDPVTIDKVKIETADILSDRASVSVTTTFRNPRDMDVGGALTLELLDPTEHIIRRTESVAARGGVVTTFEGLDGVQLWSPDDPALYEIRMVLEGPGYRDEVVHKFGFRSAEFTPNGFLLNGNPLKLRGLNRHQSFPYVGYALGKRAQEKDAETLKYDLACNVVRTSHYPQSTYFLDHCDRIGLLVMEEIPGWQHIGGDAWKRESVANVRRMIERDWNHPSIILWGVRINESADDHAFYAETNAVARQLDPTRQTGGVRCIDNSELLEDVYTMNDFFMGANKAIRGNRPPVPLRDQQDVTGLGHNVPYLVTEFNGHMYPTKRFDQEERLAEHVLRHLRVLDTAYGDPNISGAIGWCMADYNTHRDFGSGDRICYHGVLDMFREPKFAAWVYSSQGDPEDGAVMKPVTHWSRGERAIGGVLPLIVLTNCDYIDFSFGDLPPKRIYPDRQNFPHLPHAPVVIDARSVAPEEIGAWGTTWEDGTFVGYLNGEEVERIVLPASPIPTTLAMGVDEQRLELGDHRDSTRVVLRALDQHGNLLPFLDEVISLDVEGPAKIIGPDVITLRGGSAAFWVETIGRRGAVTLTAFGQRMGIATVGLDIR